MGKLNWKSYGDRGLTAKSANGRWVITDGELWNLWFEPNFTRGMVSRGEYATRAVAQARAELEEPDPT